MNAAPREPAALPPNAFDRLARVIDQVSIWSGKAVAWLIVPMFLVLFWEVMVRKFYHPTLWANDIATMCYGAHFFIAGAYTLHMQKHIRTDFFSRNWSLRTQVLMDLFQYLFLFLPGMVLFTWLSLEYAAESWDLREALMTTWRPPAYWYKSVIPLSSALILLQGLAEVVKCLRTLRTGVDYRTQSEPGELT